MKHLLRCATAVLLMALFTVPALAVPRWTFYDAAWRSTGLAANFPCGSVVTGQGFCDSMVRNRSVTADAAFYNDTTAVIDISEWTSAPPIFTDSLAANGASNAQDSIPWAVVYVYPTTGVTASHDTIHFSAQVSNDGYNWVAWGTPVQLFLATAHDGSLTNAIIALEVGTNGGAYVELSQLPSVATTTSAAGVSSAAAAAPPPGRLFGGWRFLRFITVSDASGSLRCRVGHWREVPGVVKLKTDRLTWRTTSTTTGPNCRVISGTQTECDSAFVTQTTSRTDTTAAISTEGWTYNDLWNMRSGGLMQADSLFYGQVVFAPNERTLGSSFTSTTIETQVSLNGSTWLASSTVSAAQVGTTKHSFLYLKAGAARTSVGPGSPHGPRMPVSGTAPARAQLWGFPFIRFIVTANVNGMYEGWLKRWVVERFDGTEFK